MEVYLAIEIRGTHIKARARRAAEAPRTLGIAGTLSRGHASSALACSARLTRVAARAAVAVVAGGVDTGIATRRGARRTEAGAVLASRTVGADIATASAVTRIAQEIDAVVSAEPRGRRWAAVGFA